MKFQRSFLAPTDLATAKHRMAQVTGWLGFDPAPMGLRVVLDRKGKVPGWASGDPRAKKVSLTVVFIPESTGTRVNLELNAPYRGFLWTWVTAFLQAELTDIQSWVGAGIAPQVDRAYQANFTKRADFIYSVLVAVLPAPIAVVIAAPRSISEFPAFVAIFFALIVPFYIVIPFLPFRLPAQPLMTREPWMSQPNPLPPVTEPITPSILGRS
jgi:hypothetical protein